MSFFIKNKSIEPKCEYCIYAKIPDDRCEALCVKKGVVELDFSCKKFKYDALKRIPTKITLQTDFTQEDFKI